MLRDLRRKSLSLDKGALERMRTERRGSLAATSTTVPPLPEKQPQRRGSIVHRWFRHISEAAEAYKAREAKNKRPDLPTLTPTAPVPTGPAVETPSQPTPPPPPPEAATPTKAKETEENGELPNVAVDGTEEGELSKSNDQTAPTATPASAAELEAVTQKAEKLRRKDEMVMDALLEKHLLVADLLHVPHEEFDSIAEMASEPTPDRDINELLLSAIYHTDNLKVAINETLRVTEEEAVSARSEGTVHTCVGGNVSGCSPRAGGRRTLAHRMPGVPVPPLLNISNALSSTLSLLLKHVKEREEERDRLRRELQRSRELIHARNQAEQRLQWQEADMLSSETAAEANAESKGEGVDGCESGMRGLDLRASAAEGDMVDSSPQVNSNLNTSLQNSEGENEETEEQGKSLGESTDDPGGDVYVDALSFGETEVVASKEQAAVVGEMEEDSLEGEVEPQLPVPKAGTDVPDGC